MKKYVISVEDDYPIEKLLKEFKNVEPYGLQEELEEDETDELLKLIRQIRNNKNSAFKKIKDPVAWQREIREDRILPFRED